MNDHYQTEHDDDDTDDTDEAGNLPPILIVPPVIAERVLARQRAERAPAAAGLRPWLITVADEGWDAPRDYHVLAANGEAARKAGVKQARRDGSAGPPARLPARHVRWVRVLPDYDALAAAADLTPRMPYGAPRRTGGGDEAQ